MEIKFADSFTNLPSPIIHQCNKWLVVNKPTGMSTYGVNPGDNGISEWISLHYKIKIYVCSRLDRGTSGVLIFALTAKASKEAEIIHKNESSGKLYYLISDSKDTGRNSWTCTDSLDGKKCKTVFRKIRGGKKYTLFSAEISRGRKHQIRRHASTSGITILGDAQYGGAKHSRLCLHCGEVKWPGIEKRLSSELPGSFEHLVEDRVKFLLDIETAYERRHDWPTAITDAFRLIHRGEVKTPDKDNSEFSLDLYGQWLLITGYNEKLSSAKLKEYLSPLFDWLEGRFDLKGGIIRTNRRGPRKNNLFADSVIWKKKPPPSHVVNEQEIVFEIFLNDSQHAGLFLDQRDSRMRIRDIASGKRVVNLFSFTCSFSVAAIKGGAEVVFSIDLSRGALQRGKDNFSCNNLLDEGAVKFIKEDVLKWLERQKRKKMKEGKNYQNWDIIICDPPVFASSGRGNPFSVEKQWPLLAENISYILSDKGIALMSNNHRGGHDKYYLEELEKRFSKVLKLSPQMDFPHLPGTPDHSRTYWCEA